MLKTILNKIQEKGKEDIKQEQIKEFISEQSYSINLPQKGFIKKLSHLQQQSKSISSREQITRKTVIKRYRTSKNDDISERQQQKTVQDDNSESQNKIKSLRIHRDGILKKFQEDQNIKQGKLINLQDMDGEEDGDEAIFDVFQNIKLQDQEEDPKEEEEQQNEEEQEQKDIPQPIKVKPRLNKRGSTIISNNTLKQMKSHSYKQISNFGDALESNQEEQSENVQRKSIRFQTQIDQSKGFSQFYENAVIYKINTNPDENVEQIRKQSRKQRLTAAPLPKIDQYKSFKKQVDKELLGLLVLRWNKQTPIRSPRKKRTKKLVSVKQCSLKQKFRQIIPSLINFLNRMNRCKNWNKINIKHPYQNEGSFYFLRAAKFQCLDTIQGMFDKYGKYFVYDFDHIGRTALHLTSANGNRDLAYLLIEKGADIEACDFLNRKPLYYAIQNNNFKIVRLLVKNRCDPFSQNGVNYHKLTDNKNIEEFLHLAQKVHLLIQMAPARIRNWMFEKKLKEFQQNMDNYEFEDK